MRNLKRAMSLVLAAAMLVGMMVVSAGAAYDDFTDKDEIVNTEAVATLVALNVINGKEDGSYFDPTGIVTRAEMAKMITVVLNGGKDPVLGTKDKPTFSDIKGNWAESYIEYCTSPSVGVISGRGNGKFDPTATVTAAEAAKMLLVSLGYDADVFKLTGASWQINTDVNANNAKLYDGLSISSSAPLSRDNAAQMIYNALNAFMMIKSYDKVLSNGEISYNYNLSTTKTLLSEKFGAQVFVGSFDGNSDVLSLKDGYIQVTGALTTDDTSAAGWTDKVATFPSDLDISNIGEQVKVIFKDATGGTAGKPDAKDTIYGVYNTGATEVLNSTVAGIKRDLGNVGTNAKKVQIDGVKYDVAAAPDTTSDIIVKNYGASTVAAGTANEAGTKAAIEALAAQKGDTVKFIFNDNGKICKAYVVESKLAVVTAVNNEKVTMNSSVGSIVIADNDVYSGIKKNDVVVVTTLYKSTATTDGAYTIVEKAEVVTGKVTSYTAATSSTTEKVVLDGTTYKIYNKAAMPTSVGSETGTAAFTTSDINGTFDLYLVNGMVAAAVKTSESATNYSLVVDKNNGSATSTLNPLKIVVMGADGTKTALTVSDKSPATSFNVGDIVTYTGTADAAKVSVKTAWATGTASTANFYNKTSKTLEGTVTAADAVLFVQTASGKTIGASDATYKAYNIRSLGNITTTGKDYKVLTDADGKVVAAVVNLQGVPSGATSSAVYGIVTGFNGVVEINESYYNQYTIWAGEEIIVNIAENSGTNDSLTKGSIVKFNPSADQTYANNTSFAAHGGTAVYVKNYDENEQLLTYFTGKTGSAGSFTGTGVTTKAVAEDVKIIYVDANADAAGSEIGVNGFDTVNGYKNAIIVTDASDSNVITHIIVETSGKCDIDA